MSAPLPPESRERWSRVERLGTALARLTGHREAALRQAEETERRVALAKGRLNTRRHVEAFLDELQVEQNRRNVSSYETLLTALTQEVLLGVSPIRLELGTERNLPSLDVLVERSGGQREDVFEDQGGGLTNVVVAGLRLIAVVKSRTARFVAFDEPDCWISPDRVPAFFRVLEDASRRLGIQCFTVTHHDVRSFGGDVQVARIEGHPDTGVSVVSETAEAAWPDAAAPGIRWVRLVNVQGYADATLRLSPGFTALTGPNGHGKSTFSRALRAVFFGEARDSLVRHGERSCTIEMGVADGRTLRFVRNPRRSPVNVWSLHEPDGSVVKEDDFTFETAPKSKGTVPDWVGARYGIHPVQDLDVHVAHQKKPVFLLTETAPVRASVLSIGQEADYVRRMIVLHRERCSRDQATVRDGEREIDDKRRVAAALRGIEASGAQVADLRARLEEIDGAVANLAEAEVVVDRLAAARAAYDAALRRRDALARVPGPEALETLAARIRSGKEREAVVDRFVSILDAWGEADARARALDALPGAVPELRLADAHIPLGKAVAEARRSYLAAQERARALASLPASPPAPADTTAREKVLAGLQAAARAAEDARTRGRDLARQEAEVRAELDAVLADTGGLCPACGQAVEDPSMLIEGHVH